MARRGRFRMGKKQPAHERRAKDAADRKAATGDLTPQQKLERLDRALGVGVGAKKERAKLAAKLAGATRVAATPSAASLETKSEAQPVILASDGAATMSLSAGSVNIIVGNRKTPVISMSQLRRMGDQHGFDGAEFAKKYRDHLVATGQP